MRGTRFRFGSFELDTVSSELRKNGLRIRIEDQPSRILSMLVSRPGDVVTREELKEALWADDTHVDFDRSLTRAVNKVRVAINDSASNPRYVETLPKRGYRFVAPVTRFDEPSEIPPPSAPVETNTALPYGKGKLRWWAAKLLWWATAAAALAVAAAALAVAAIAGFVLLRDPGKRIASIAVLPLENVSGDSEGNYFGDGMTDQLIADLSRIPSLRVVSLKSVMRYKGSRKELAEIARELNVEGIVDGSITRSGDRVRINARLVRFPGERTVSTKTYERAAAEVLSVQSELAKSIAAEIGASIRPEDETRLAAAARPVDPQLHALYLRGRFFANEPGRDSLEKGIAIMESVVRRDPLHAGAYSTAAEAWFTMSSVFVHPAQAMPNARAAARRAIALDPSNDVARATLGRVHLFYDWDWQAAEEQFQKAIDLNPNSAEAYRGLSCLRLAKGQRAGALESIKRSVELSPRSLWTNFYLVLQHHFAGQYDEAIAEAKSTLEWAPDFGLIRSFLGVSYLQKGQIPKAIRELEAAVKSLPIPTTLGFLAIGYARAGRTADAERITGHLVALAKKQYVCPFEVGAAFAALGRNDEAFRWMNQGVADRADCMVYLRSEPWLRSLRNDPRYPALVRSVGFPER